MQRVGTGSFVSSGIGPFVFRNTSLSMHRSTEIYPFVSPNPTPPQEILKNIFNRLPRNRSDTYVGDDVTASQQKNILAIDDISWSREDVTQQTKEVPEGMMYPEEDASLSLGC